VYSYGHTTKDYNKDSLTSRLGLGQNPQRLGLGAICLGLGLVGLISDLGPLRLVETFCAGMRRAYVCSCS